MSRRLRDKTRCSISTKTIKNSARTQPPRTTRVVRNPASLLARRKGDFFTLAPIFQFLRPPPPLSSRRLHLLCFHPPLLLPPLTPSQAAQSRAPLPSTLNPLLPKRKSQQCSERRSTRKETRITWQRRKSDPRRAPVPVTVKRRPCTATCAIAASSGPQTCTRTA